MVKRRKFLIGIGSLAAGSAAAMGTGAFSRVQATRDITIQTSEDAGGYLKLSTNGGPNSEYTSTTEGGELVIDFDSSEDQGDGVNPNAVTTFDKVFRLANHGTQPVDIWFEHDLPGVMFHRFENSLDGWENRKEGLAEGAHMGIGIEVDTTVEGVNLEDISGDVIVYAQDSDDDSAPGQQ